MLGWALRNPRTKLCQSSAISSEPPGPAEKWSRNALSSERDWMRPTELRCQYFVLNLWEVLVQGFAQNPCDLLSAGTYFSRLSFAAAARQTKEGSSYADLNDSDLAYFKDILGSEACISDQEKLLKHNRDWMKRYQGTSRLALEPRSTEHVSAILKYCNNRRLAVVPQAGNSGLCGGSVPISDEIILLTGKLNEIIAFDDISGALVCQAGCTLKFLQDYVSQRGFTIPLDLGAKECQAGGFVSTNAGGLRFLRYGSLRGSVLGVEAVTPSGTVLDLLQPLRKNNTGYDLKQLFIGGEGTLGVVTAVSLLCPPKARSINLAYLACHSFQDVQQVLVKARQHLGEILSAFEFLDKQALRLTLAEIPEASNPISSSENPFYVMLETAGSNKQHDSAKIKGFLASADSDGLIASSRIAEGEDDMRRMWFLREHISVALSKRGPVYKYDLSLPVAEIYRMVEETRERVKAHKEATVVSYGHLGDGNVHLNISVPRYSDEILSCIEPFVYEYTARHKGSISAEHGLGQMKNDYIGYSKPDSAIELMGQLKKMFDPNLILNPQKYLPSEFWSEPLQSQHQYCDHPRKLENS